MNKGINWLVYVVETDGSGPWEMAQRERGNLYEDLEIKKKNIS